MIYSPLISTSLPAFSLFLRTFPALSIFLLTYSSTYSVTCWVCRTQNSWTASTSEGTRYTAGRWRRCHLLRIAWVLVRAVAPTMARCHSLCAFLQRPPWERNEWESNFRLVPHKEGYQYPWLIAFSFVSIPRMRKRFRITYSLTVGWTEHGRHGADRGCTPRDSKKATICQV